MLIATKHREIIQKMNYLISFENDKGGVKKVEVQLVKVFGWDQSNL